MATLFLLPTHPLFYNMASRQKEGPDIRAHILPNSLKAIFCHSDHQASAIWKLSQKNTTHSPGHRFGNQDQSAFYRTLVRIGRAISSVSCGGISVSLFSPLFYAQH